MLQGIYLDFLYINGISMIMFTKTLKYFQLDCFDITFDNMGGYSTTEKKWFSCFKYQKSLFKAEDLQ